MRNPVFSSDDVAKAAEAAAQTSERARRELRNVLFGSSRDRLNWMLNEFVYRDLTEEKLQPEERDWLWEKLRVFIGEVTGGQWTVYRKELEKGPVVKQSGSAAWPVTQFRAYVSADEMGAAQAVVREALEDLAGGKALARDMRPRLQVRVAAPRTSASGTPPAELTLTETFEAPIVEAALFTALMLARPPTRLLRCPYRGTKTNPQPECGRVFAAVVRQQWCVVHKDDVRQDKLREARKERKKAERLRTRKSVRARRRRKSPTNQRRSGGGRA